MGISKKKNAFFLVEVMIAIGISTVVIASSGIYFCLLSNRYHQTQQFEKKLKTAEFQFESGQIELLQNQMIAPHLKRVSCLLDPKHQLEIIIYEK